VLQLLSADLDCDALAAADAMLGRRDRRVATRVQSFLPLRLRAAWELRRIDPAFDTLQTFGAAALLAAAIAWPGKVVHVPGARDPVVPGWVRVRLGSQLTIEPATRFVQPQLAVVDRDAVRLRLGVTRDHDLIWPLSAVTLRRGYSQSIWTAGILSFHDPRVRVALTDRCDVEGVTRLLSAQDQIDLCCDARGLSLSDLAHAADVALLVPESPRFERLPLMTALAAGTKIVASPRAAKRLDASQRDRVVIAASDQPSAVARSVVEMIRIVRTDAIGMSRAPEHLASEG
jgi:hypothetical protein